ncbi:MAG: TrpB-like pyridoxal phosphate-dependent enzyme [Nitrospirota bacterium]|nr:TrpB-like pyridoxal phosphate-dependent enzyme [Nitrospirota bacterium]
MEPTKILLGDEAIPKFWYNILADLPWPLPPALHPKTRSPLSPNDLAGLFPKSLVEQEMSHERLIEIPDEVLEAYKMWRPTPLHRAYRLERALDTPAKIYYKYEGGNPSGSHKLNTALPQAYFNRQEGIKRLTTETGAGQWGSALSLACSLFGLECRVFMVRISYDQKPYRRILMETWGATCIPSPSQTTQAGRNALAQDPETPGTLGIAISEAIEEALARSDTHYALGSVLNHVLLHQTVIGLEAKAQLASIGVMPDVIVGCVGGGSNFAGLVLPFVPEKLSGRKVKMVCVEPIATPSLTKGAYIYDYADTAGLTPLLKMHTLGKDFVPPKVHAGGLRYHGMAPIVSFLYDNGLLEAQAVEQQEAFSAAVIFARTEGVVPAPESAHALRVAISEAMLAKEEGKNKVILLNLSGHGYLDLSAYDAYLKGQISPKQEA